MKFLSGIDTPTATLAATTPANSATRWANIRDELRDDAKNALLFSQAKMSIYYDQRHKPITFDVGDMVYVRLAESMQPGYHLPQEVCRKLSQQRIGPFKILERVGTLAYKLDLPPT
jgi:hypothetical protein